MTARFFITALGCQRLKPSPRPLPCSRANCARYVRYIVLGTIGYLKELSLSLLARFVCPWRVSTCAKCAKCAKKCVWTPLARLALRGATQ
jgi:hypothetical protein